jgi:hypothetical protein
MRQVWAKTEILFGIDEYGHPYLADYPLMVSREDHTISEYTDSGMIDLEQAEGIEGLEEGRHYVGNLTIFQDDKNEEDVFRFSSVRRVQLTHD